MTLRTVRVPAEVEPLFARAEEVVSQFFSQRRDDPTTGTIEIFGERYVLVRAASLSVEFFDLVRGLYGPGREREGDDFARNILYDLAHAIGRADARNFHAKMGLEDPISRLSAGPVHFAHAGWAFVDISPESRPVPGPGFYLQYDHPFSFESDAWVRGGRAAAFPVCIMNAGYSSGWCSESFGLSLVSAEVECRARGGERCSFVMAAPDAIEAHVARYEASHPPRGGVTVAHEIPDFFSRKRVEEDLRRRFAEELREREAAEAKLRMAQKLEAVGRLAGGIAHDFNNLMAVVIARSAMLASRFPPGDRLRAEIDQIAEAGERASALTKQLLAFSQAQVVKKEPLELDAVVGRLMTLLSSVLGEQIELAVALGASSAVVQLDRSQLEQVVTNLVVNARDAMPRGGRLDVATRVVAEHAELGPGPFVEIRVRDQGDGMDAATIACLFEPYFTTKPGYGTGLGLATVHGIVKQSGGAIGVESAPMGGSTFTVALPVHAATLAEVAPDAARRSRGRAPSTRLKIMLVEDNPDVRAAVEQTISYEGHDAVAYGDSVAAAEIDDAALASVDLLLTDVVMPKKGGREVALLLRSRRPELPVIFMSGYPPEPEMLATVADARFVAKPFRPEELFALVAELTRG